MFAAPEIFPILNFHSWSCLTKIFHHHMPNYQIKCLVVLYNSPTLFRAYDWSRVLHRGDPRQWCLCSVLCGFQFSTHRFSSELEDNLWGLLLGLSEKTGSTQRLAWRQTLRPVSIRVLLLWRGNAYKRQHFTGAGPQQQGRKLVST